MSVLRSAASSQDDRYVVHRHVGDFGGIELTISYRVRDIEHRRRLDAGVVAIENERMLAALIDLPSDTLGPVEPRFASLFAKPESSASALVLEDPDGGLWAQRRADVPVDVLDIEMSAPTWAKAARLAHQWVGYAARTVHLDGIEERHVDLVLTEASFYGIGVSRGEEAEVILAPAEFVSQRWTSARWWFAEQIYAQFRALSEIGDR